MCKIFQVLLSLVSFAFFEVGFAADARDILKAAINRPPEDAGKFFEDIVQLKATPKNIKIVRIKAGEGEVYAQTCLGALCLDGTVKEGREKAKILLQEAADKDCVIAQLMLWVLLRAEKNQEGVEQLRELIAARHLHFCQYAIADYYLESGDQEKAIPFLRTAAELKNSKAQLKLGLILLEQEAAKKEACCWLREAMCQGETEAREKLLEMADPDVSYLDKYLADCQKGYAYGAVVHVVEAAKKGRPQALKILRRAAGDDNGHALMALAGIYEAGHGVEADHERALGYYQRAHKQGALKAFEGVKRLEKECF